MWRHNAVTSTSIIKRFSSNFTVQSLVSVIFEDLKGFKDPSCFSEKIGTWKMCGYEKFPTRKIKPFPKKGSNFEHVWTSRWKYGKTINVSVYHDLLAKESLITIFTKKTFLRNRKIYLFSLFLRSDFIILQHFTCVW